MIRLNIDGFEVTAQEGQTILEVARANGIDIPTLCHDDRVKPQGACGLCVVEPEGDPRLQGQAGAGQPRLLRACATAVTPGMVIRTQSPRVRASRQAALELLLSTHSGDCRPPCQLACPAHMDCQGYTALIANGEYREAVALMKEAHPLPASIGRVCPHPCEKECRRQLAEEPINLASLKYFAADRDLNSGETYQPECMPDTRQTVVIVGGGPAGLTAAYFLRREGHYVVVYDANPHMGGMLRYGIPEYRLPKAVLDAELTLLTEMGVQFVNRIRLGRDFTLPFLCENYDAVIIATGAWVSKKLGCPGEQLQGVLGGIDFLGAIAQGLQPVTLGQRVVVVGGSNTAMDAARTAIRLGVPEVRVVYRRTRNEMPAEASEIQEAEDEGVIFNFLVNPIEIIGENGHATSVRLQKMTLGEPDAGGRRSPVPIEGEDEILAVDTVIMAIGQDVDLTGLDGLPVTKRGYLDIDEHSFFTGIHKVYAIGDVTGRSAYAIEAIGHARRAASEIDAFLKGFDKPRQWDGIPTLLVKDQKSGDDYINEPRQPRESPTPIHEAYKQGFAETTHGLTAEQAEREAKRCLACGCEDFWECKLLRYANEYNADPNLYNSDTHTKHTHAKDESHPFMSRNPDKCILCGLCVRVCDEVMGRTALGLMGRGFDTEVKTAFNKPLTETDCTSCGQCAALCPTGAITERQPLIKPVVIREEPVKTVCAFCSVGCGISLSAKGSLLLRSRPDPDANPQALLCAKGRFGFGELNRLNQSDQRLLKPLTRVNGQLTETSWETAFETIRRQIRSLTAVYGSDSIGVALSDTYTNEDIYTIREYARQIINTPHIFTFSGMPSGLKDVTGRDASTNRLEELAGTDVILLIARDIIKTHMVAGIYIKKAIENGAKLILIDPGASQADEWATMKFDPAQSPEMLIQMTRAIMDMAPVPANAEGYDELHAYLEPFIPEEEVSKAAALYMNAKRAMIVFDPCAVTSSASRLIADMAVLSGQIGRPRAGIIQLKPNSNSQGLCDLGIETDTSHYEAMIQSRAIQGLLVFGEDIPAVDLSPLAFLAVMDLTLTETAQKADVVLPAASFAETAGSFTDTVRVTRPINAVIQPKTSFTNRQIIDELSNSKLDFHSVNDLSAYVDRELHTLHNNEPVLYTDGRFAHTNGRARLLVPESGIL